jgi:hypothetical protein
VPGPRRVESSTPSTPLTESPQPFNQVYWSSITCTQPLPPHLALIVGIYNNSLDVLNSLILAYNLAYHRSGAGILTDSDWKQYIGLLLVVVGALIEVVPEEQRRAFKRNKENKGKIQQTGVPSPPAPVFLGQLVPSDG